MIGVISNPDTRRQGSVSPTRINLTLAVTEAFKGDAAT